MRAAARAKAERAVPLEYNLLLTATLCLLAFGAVMVYSASSARALLQGQGDGTGFLVKYVAYGALGLVGMHVARAARPRQHRPAHARCSSRSRSSASWQ